MNVDGSRTAPSIAEQALPAARPALGWLALLASSTTLVCCALPIALVTLGFGATVAALTSVLPALVVLSEQKAWLFGVSAVLMAVTAWSLWRAGRACPAEPLLAARCEQRMRWNRRVLGVSAGVWLVGFLAAYLALPLRIWLGV